MFFSSIYIIFIFLLARFRSERLTNCIENLFNQFIIKLGELNEIRFKNIFIDGTKIEAYANRYSFVWLKATQNLKLSYKKKQENY